MRKNHCRPLPLIALNSKTSGATACGGNRNAYWFTGAILAAASALSTVAFGFPERTQALCFLSCFTPTAEANSTGLISDPSLALLTAAKNLDPDPTKGEADLGLTEGSALIAEAGPGGSAPDTPSIRETSSIASYTVEDGDTLSQIAADYGVSVNTILWANNLTIKSTIKPGMTLVILPVSGIQHTIISGETLASLATKYHAQADEIATYNGLASGDTLVAGEKIIIPGGELATTVSTGSATGSSLKQGGGLKTIIANPYKGGSGAADNGYYGNPLPGGILTQGIHGWNAVDIGAPAGTPIYAAASGIVVVAQANGGWNGGYGNYVVLSHANGTQTLYAHMSRVAASMGASVSKGQIIGYVGRTGEATGNHLHFEVRGAANPFRNCALNKACSPQ